MFHAYCLELDYGNLPFKVRILNEQEASFKPSSDSENTGIKVTKTSVIFEGSESNNQGNKLNLIVLSTNPKIDIQLSTRCTERRQWQPISIGIVGMDNTLKNEFNPPDNILEGTITLPTMVQTIELPMQSSNSEDRNLQLSSHGFLDLQSFFLIGFYSCVAIILGIFSFFMLKRMKRR